VLTDIGRAPTFYDVGVELEAAPPARAERRYRDDARLMSIERAQATILARSRDKIGELTVAHAAQPQR
jgi:hypothetical protein